jgi:hypothetical protein
MIPVSVFYIASQDEDRIEDSLASVQGWVKEIVVVVDRADGVAAQIAVRYGARVVVNAWRGFGPQKRFAEDQCCETWLLNLDADEVVSPALREKLTALFQLVAPSCDAYQMPIRFRFAFEDQPHPGAYFNAPPRLYDKRKARFRDHPVHDTVIPLDPAAPWTVGWIKADIMHCSCRHLSHFVEKLNQYSDMQARVLFEAGRKPPAWRVCVEALWTFPKCYFGRRYYYYGVHGLTYAALWSIMRMVRLAKARELFHLRDYKTKVAEAKGMNADKSS